MYMYICTCHTERFSLHTSFSVAKNRLLNATSKILIVEIERMCPKLEDLENVVFSHARAKHRVRKTRNFRFFASARQAQSRKFGSFPFSRPRTKTSKISCFSRPRSQAQIRRFEMFVFFRSACQGRTRKFWSRVWLTHPPKTNPKS